MHPLGSANGLLSVLTAASTGKGLIDERTINKNYKKDFKLPENPDSFLFPGNKDVKNSMKCAEENDQMGLAIAMKGKCITPGAVSSAINQVKESFLKEDNENVEKNASNIRDEMQAWLNSLLPNTPTDDAKKQRYDEIVLSYRHFEWAKDVTSHSMRRSAVTHLAHDFSATEIAKNLTGHSNPDQVLNYTAADRKQLLQEKLGNLVSQSNKMQMKQAKRVHSDEEPCKKICSPSNSTSSTWDGYASDCDSDWGPGLQIRWELNPCF